MLRVALSNAEGENTRCTTGRLLWSRPVSFRRADQRNHVSPIAPVDTEIRLIDGDDAVARMKLAQTNETEVARSGCRSRYFFASAANWLRWSVTLMAISTSPSRTMSTTTAAFCR